MVKLKVSFDKSWGKINENVITIANEIFWENWLRKNGSFYPKL
jgi:hypothetical protein